MRIETFGNLVLERGGYDLGAPVARRSTTTEPPPSMFSPDYEEAWRSHTESGEYVTPDNAARFGAVQGALRFLGETEASLPCHLYKRRRDANGREVGKDRATDNYLYSILHDAPNDEQTGFEFWQAMRVNRARWGNAYALPRYSGNGQWNNIYPLRPDWMQVTRDADGKKLYKYRPARGPFEGDYAAGAMIHVRGMGDDLEGWSPIRLLRESIGLGSAALRASSSFFRNGARMSGILELAGKVKDLGAEQAKFSEAYGGATKTGKVLVIDQGSKFVSTTIPPDDAQFIATWKAGREEVWMVYGIPPHLMGDTEKSTSFGAGIEQQVLGLLKFTTRPSLEMTQQAFERVLFNRGEREFFIEFDLDGFLQADAKTQAEVLGIERQNGIISADEWRALKNRNPIGGEEGSAYLVNGTMIPTSVALAKTAAPPTAKP